MAVLRLESDLASRLSEAEGRLNRMPFYILVWGSGAGKPSAFEKHKAIKSHLENRIGAGKVLFSEDSVFAALSEKYGLRAAEAIELEAVDAVILLDTSPGPHIEAALFEESLLAKTILFAPNEYLRSDGFAAVVYSCVKAEGFSSQELASCRSIRTKANNFIQVLRLHKYRRLSQRGVTS